MAALLKRPPSEAERLYRPPSAAARPEGRFIEPDIVVLVKPATTFDGEAVVVGSVGTVVSAYNGGTAYDVEFDSGIACVKLDAIVANK